MPVLLLLELQLLVKEKTVSAPGHDEDSYELGTCLLALCHCLHRLLSSLLNLLHECLLLSLDLCLHLFPLQVDEAVRIEIAGHEIVESIRTEYQRSELTKFGLHIVPFVELLLRFSLLGLDSPLKFLHANTEHRLAGLLAVRGGPFELLLIERVPNRIGDLDQILLSLIDEFVRLHQMFREVTIGIVEKSKSLLFNSLARVLKAVCRTLILDFRWNNWVRWVLHEKSAAKGCSGMRFALCLGLDPLLPFEVLVDFPLASFTWRFFSWRTPSFPTLLNIAFVATDFLALALTSDLVFAMLIKGLVRYCLV